MTALQSSRPVHSHRLDVAIAGALFIAAGTIAVFFLRDVGVTFFYQTQMPATVMAACGRAFEQPVPIPDALLDFLFMRTTSFDCSQLSSVRETLPPGNLAIGHFYLASSVAWVWRWLGVSYQSLWPLFAVLHGSYAVGCFVLGRLFFGRVIATAIGLLIAISPVAISALFWLRDFSKAPFIVWALVLLVLLLRIERPRALLLASVALGAIIDLGAGFRIDVIVMLPIAVAVIAVWVDRKFSLVLRLSTILVLAAVSFAPVAFSSSKFLGNGGFLILEGASEPFREHLGLAPAPYDLGWRYLDEIALSTVAADLRRKDPESYDRAESRPFEGVTQTYTRSTQYALGWLPIFSADVATRALKSAVLLAGFPALLAYDRQALDPFRIPYPAKTAIAQVSARYMEMLAQPWMPAVGILGLLVFLLRVYARSTREAACLAAIFLLLLAYPSMQFSTRHFFHLEVLFWLALASLIVLPFEFAKLRPFLPRYGFRLGCVAAAGTVIYVALIALQDYRLKREVTRLIESPKQAIATTSVEIPGDRVLTRIPVQEQYLSLTQGPPDALTSALVETTPPFEVRAAADRLAVHIGGPKCEPGTLSIELVYRKGPLAWQALDRTLTFQVAQARELETLLIIPAFYRPTQHFDGLAVPKSRADCIRAVDRILDSRRLPAVFSAVLAPDWKGRPFFLTLAP